MEIYTIDNHISQPKNATIRCDAMYANREHAIIAASEIIDKALESVRAERESSCGKYLHTTYETEELETFGVIAVSANSTFEKAFIPHDMTVYVNIIEVKDEFSNDDVTVTYR